MKIYEIITENVARFPNRPFTIKIGTHRKPKINRSARFKGGLGPDPYGIKNDGDGYEIIEYMDEDSFDAIIDNLLPSDEPFDPGAAERLIAIVDDDVDRTGIVLLPDGRIGYQDTLGEYHSSVEPISVQQFTATIRQQTS